MLAPVSSGMRVFTGPSINAIVTPRPVYPAEWIFPSE